MPSNGKNNEQIFYEQALYPTLGLIHKKLNLIFEQCNVSILLTNFVFDEASKMLALLCLHRPAKIHALVKNLTELAAAKLLVFH
jgi:hypothetical protein